MVWLRWNPSLSLGLSHFPWCSVLPQDPVHYQTAFPVNRDWFIDRHGRKFSRSNSVTSGYTLMDICGKNYPLPNSDVNKEEYSLMKLPFCYKSQPEDKITYWEDIREPTSVIYSLGTHGDSLWFSGAEDACQGPWEPRALRAALSLGSQATAEGYLLLPSPPSDRALTAGALGSVQPTSP